MRKIDELRGPSCLTSAKDDEPIFVLKSTDELAPDIVREWANRYWKQKRAQPGDITEKQQAKYWEAYALANLMETWCAEKADEPPRCEKCQGWHHPLTSCSSVGKPEVQK